MTFRFIKRLGAALFVFSGLTVAAPLASADTYSTTTVQIDNFGFFVAGDDFGDYVIQSRDPDCGTSATGCFLVSISGTTQYEATAPTLPTDPAPVAGSGCIAKPSDFFGYTLCINGHQIFIGDFEYQGKTYQGVFGDPDPTKGALSDRQGGVTVDGPSFLTANGDFYFDNGLGDNLDVAIDTTSAAVAATPEPSSWLLMGTGVMAILGLVRRRQLMPLATRAR